MTRGKSRAQAILIVALMALLAACGAGSSGDTSAGGAGESAADLLVGQFATISGETIDLGSLEGQDVVLWFWAPW